MSEHQSFDEIVRLAFQASLEAEYDQDEYHYVDDDDFLIDLSLAEISGTKRSQFISHLAGCSYCRHELSRMLRAGVLQLPEFADLQNAGPERVNKTEPAERLLKRDATGKDPKRLFIGVAASILLLAAAAMLFWPQANHLGLAQNALASGQYMSAIEHAEAHLNSPLDDASRRDAEQVLHDAAYRQSLQSLSVGSFQAVESLSRRAEQAAGPSPGLANLRVQALRQQASASAWTEAGKLTRYGYQLDGRSLAKTIPETNETEEQILATYERAIEAFPKDVPLRLNYGQYMLERSDPEAATVQFAAAQQLVPDSVEAQMGLGISAFQSGQWEAAAQHFQAVLARDAHNPDAILNLAISYRKGGRTADAVSWFRKLLERLPPGEQREEVQRVINEHSLRSPPP